MMSVHEGFSLMTRAANGELNDKEQLSNLIPMDSPQAVLEEVKFILSRISTDLDPTPLTAAFHMIVDLFSGQYPGYRACNTEFHDIHHTNHVFLAMARLIHGAVVDGEKLSPHQTTLGLMAAMFHDSGYIQEISDTTGTGAKYTVNHVDRSMDLFAKFGERIGMPNRDISSVQAIILCTNLSVDIDTIKFRDALIRLLGQLMGAADVLAQMADRIYIEKLLFLYREFRESGMGGYDSELDLLRKTVGFYDFITKRLSSSLGGVDRFMRSHFRTRWDIDQDLYKIAIAKQKGYLRDILQAPDASLLDHLKRGGIAESFIAKKENGSGSA